jgi:hypothetical protein
MIYPLVISWKTDIEACLDLTRIGEPPIEAWFTITFSLSLRDWQVYNEVNSRYFCNVTIFLNQPLVGPFELPSKLPSFLSERHENPVYTSYLS